MDFNAECPEGYYGVDFNNGAPNMERDMEHIELGLEHTESREELCGFHPNRRIKRKYMKIKSMPQGTKQFRKIMAVKLMQSIEFQRMTEGNRLRNQHRKNKNRDEKRKAKLLDVFGQLPIQQIKVKI